MHTSLKTFIPIGIIVGLAAFLYGGVPTAAQLAKPAIAVENIGWGWFDLKMTGNSKTPSSTHWLIVANGDTAYPYTTLRNKPLCDVEVFPGRIPNDFTADARDLTAKHIIGCSDNTTFVAKVRYTDGTRWSAYSDPITFSTPAEPARSDDTVYVLLYGHSLAAFNGVCGMLPGSGFLVSASDGYQAPGGGNGFGHALQTELRRVTGRTITLINWGMNNTRQSRWLRSGTGSDKAIDHQAGETYENFIRYYKPGDGRYLDTGKYKVAVFFFGQNDAREPQDCSAGSYPVSNYIADATSIISQLTARGVRVVYNSLQYATPKDCDSGHWEGAPMAQQQRYYNAWDSLTKAMVRVNGRLWRGLDFFALFRSDTVRFHYPDGIHMNLSEGIPAVVDSLARIIRNAIDSNRALGAVPGAEAGDGYALQVLPERGTSSVSIQISGRGSAGAVVEVVDVLGRSVYNYAQSGAGYSGGGFRVQTGKLAPGTYLCRLKYPGKALTRKFQVMP